MVTGDIPFFFFFVITGFENVQVRQILQDFIFSQSIVHKYGVKRSRHQLDHSPPTSAEVKIMWIYTSIPPCIFTFTLLFTRH
jgi:hypothetical protein